MSTATDDGYVDQEEGGFDDGMEFVSSANGELTEKDMVSSGGAKTVNQDGKYHCIITGMKIDKPTPVENPKEGKPHLSMPSVQISFQVVGGDHPEQMDKAIYHRLYLWKWCPESGRYVMKTGKEIKFQTQIATAVGAATFDKDTDQLKFNFKELTGRQAIVEIRNEPYDENKDTGKPKSMKDSFRVPFGNVWKPDDESQKDVPKNPDYMAIYLGGLTASEEPEALF